MSVISNSIPLFKVHMPEEMTEAVGKTLQSGFITEGPKAAEFQKQFQDWLGNPNTAMVNSCTSALTLALRLAGVGPGDEVISSPMTCVATNEPVITAGAKIVWADVDPETGNIDPEDVRRKIKQGKTKAILFVDWSGVPADLDKLQAIADDNQIKTIEDAAHSLGAVYRGRKVGNQCDFTCFSFQAIKHITTGEGGAIACKSKEDFDRAVLLRWFGLPRGWRRSPVHWEGDIAEAGYKMHMNDIAGTMGIVQMKYIDEIVEKHKANAKKIREGLKDVEGIEFLKIDPQVDPAYWILTVLLEDSEAREKFAAKISEADISCGIAHTRNDSYTVFAESQTELPGLDQFADRMLNIPCGWWLTDEEIQYIVETVKQSIGG